jgi:hypothetical protein
LHVPAFGKEASLPIYRVMHNTQKIIGQPCAFHLNFCFFPTGINTMHASYWMTFFAVLCCCGLCAHPLSFYAFLLEESSIELMDGSEWQIADADLSIAKAWNKGDQLTLHIDSAWFSTYRYFIYNKDCQSKIRANLRSGPFVFGPLSNWIVHMDRFNSHLYLQDGTAWCIQAPDAELLADWDINDHIMVGQEEKIRPQWSHVLINIDTNQRVKACQYYAMRGAVQTCKKSINDDNE